MSSTKSAVRALRILEEFGAQKQPLRLKDVAINLHYPISSAAALLKSLVSCGYLSFDRNSRYYYPTDKLPALGAQLASTAIEDGVLMDVMRALQQSTGELIIVGTPNDLYVEYVKALRSTQPVQLYAPVGTRRLMIQSGMGWLFMSRMDRAAAIKIYRRSIAAGELRAAQFSERQLLDRLQKLSNQDHVFTTYNDFVTRNAFFGGAMLSMLVPTAAHNRALILGIGGPADRLTKNRDKIARQMRSELRRLADLLKGRAGSAGADHAIKSRSRPA
jgi:DNA-binding IclR family transcriptional regulator